MSFYIFFKLEALGQAILAIFELQASEQFVLWVLELKVLGQFEFKKLSIISWIEGIGTIRLDNFWIGGTRAI